MKTIPELKQRRWELEDSISYGQKRGISIPSFYFTDLKDVRRNLDVALAQEAAALAKEAADKARAELEAKRAALRSVLAPDPIIWRPFIARIVDHTIDVLVEHKVAARFSLRQYACRMTRTIHVHGCMTEADSADVHHEAAHIIDPHASSEQQPHRYGDTGCISPMAEIHAWRWAIDHCYGGYWTQPMQDELARCIRTYQTVASAEEAHAIAEFIREAAKRVVPAPDSFEGRLAKVRTIRCQQRLRAIVAGPERQPRPSFDARSSRMKELGL